MEGPTISTPLHVAPPPPPRPRASQWRQQDSVLVSAATAAADGAGSVPHLRQLHAQLLKVGVRDISLPLLSKLLSFSLSSASSSSLHYAVSVFRGVAGPPTPLCNRLLRELSRSAEPDAALVAYARMREDDIPLDRFSFPPLLKAVARVYPRPAAVGVGRELHGLAAKLGFDSDPFVQTGLIRAYSTTGLLDNARRMFDHMAHRDLVAWGVMLDGYYQTGRYEEVLSLFEEMRDAVATSADAVILATVLSACGRMGDLSSGRAVHTYIADSGLELDDHLRAALVGMYAGCGAMDLARAIYDEAPSQNPVAATALISGYARAGMATAARAVFDAMRERDLVAWTAMVAGYVDCGRPREALALFNEMRARGVRPDGVAVLGAISACAELGAPAAARWVHRLADRGGFLQATPVGNALVAMHAKCGSLAAARRVFDAMPHRNVISWTAMIHGYAMHGDGAAALREFDRMKSAGVEPNEVTFLGLLYACAHAGLVDDGRRVFAAMATAHGIAAKVEHYGCMVDLLGRAKLLQEAMELIEGMPFEPNVVVWGALLAACRVHGELQLGETAARKILELDPDHDGAYVLLSNIYAGAGRWAAVAEVRKTMKARGLAKERGCSWTEAGGEVHEFATADEAHPRSGEIRSKLGEIVERLEAAGGYVPDTRCVLLELEEEDDRRRAVLLHSEKLALAFALIGDGDGRRRGGSGCVRIAKNLRVCEDCHAFMAAFSGVFATEVVLRDRTRFHHFRDGRCSCNGFW